MLWGAAILMAAVVATRGAEVTFFTCSDTHYSEVYTNTATASGSGGGTYNGSSVNSIVYGNTAPNASYVNCRTDGAIWFPVTWPGEEPPRLRYLFINLWADDPETLPPVIREIIEHND